MRIFGEDGGGAAVEAQLRQITEPWLVQERIIAKLKEERQRHRNASVVLIPDANTIGYPPAVQLTSYGHTARNSYIEQGMHGKKARMEALGFGSSYAEELANSLVEKGRQKVEHLEAMEKKRIAALLKKNIAVKDSLDDLQERCGVDPGPNRP